MTATRRVGLVAAVVFLLTSCGLPAGFAATTTQQALVQPTALAFAPDGRLFVAEKRGTIQTYDSIDDETPAQFADLREQVQNTHDHGLLALEVDKDWPNRPYLYALYSYDAPPGGTAPTSGVGTDSDPCYYYYCPSQGRVVRLTAGPEMTMTEQQVLVKDVCLQFPFHGGGGVRMTGDGALLASFGEGSFPDPRDQGQDNVCDDPVNEGGALRSQDLRTTGDPFAPAGALIRVNPDTGAAWPTNPLSSGGDPEAAKVLAYGLRNPYRFDVRPGTAEVWIGDVGSAYAEEINRVILGGPVENFGWPCWEGNSHLQEMDSLDMPLCESLYAAGGDTKPHFISCHGKPDGPGQPCTYGPGAISGVAFYRGGPYPDRYDGRSSSLTTPAQTSG